MASFGINNGDLIMTVIRLPHIGCKLYYAMSNDGT